MLELFHKNNCPYSAKVRNYIEAHGLESQIRYHETDSEMGAERQLKTMTGDSKVPVLVADGNPIQKADKIIQWLNDHVTSLNAVLT